MRRFFPLFVATFGAAAACSSFAGDSGNADAGSIDAGAEAAASTDAAPSGTDAAPSGDDGGADADVEVDTGPPLPEETCDGTVFCDDFESTTISAGWTVETDPGCVFSPQGTVKKVGTLAPFTQAAPFSAAPANGRLVRDLGELKDHARLKTWLFLNTTPAVSEQWDVLQIAFATSPARVLRVIVSLGGLKLAVNENGSSSPTVMTGAALPVPFKDWIELEIEYDLPNDVFTASVEGKPIALTHAFNINDPNEIVTATLFYGLQALPPVTAAQAYYDLLRIYSQ